MTADDFDSYVRALGYVVDLLGDGQGNQYSVVRDVTVTAGSLAGNVCDVALQRLPAIPYQAPPAIHTRPHLVQADKAATLAIQASALGVDWQYWSRRLDRPPSPKTLWTHILTVLSEA
jgi:hypothetical protein